VYHIFFVPIGFTSLLSTQAANDKAALAALAIFAVNQAIWLIEIMQR
jgi:hypothetical protein